MTDVREPPYPADTRAKGWRFELDYERIEQSGTWSAAMSAALDGLPLARPFLLATWYAAWKQVPCGSLPSDDRELAGAVGIPASMLAEYRDVLLRGWWLASDGRLYHDTLVLRVQEMMGKRRSDSDRQAAKRAREAEDAERHARESDACHVGVTRDTPVSHVGVGAESSTDHRPLKKDKPPHPPAGGAFDRFWKAWPKHPRKVAPAQCLAKWKSKGCEAIADQVIAAVEAAKASDAWRKDAGAFIPAPLVWLNQDRWRAPLPEAAKPSETTTEYLARRKREAEVEEDEKARAQSPESRAAKAAAVAHIKGVRLAA